MDEVSDALEQLWDTFTGQEPMEGALEGLVDVVLNVVTDADAVSITIDGTTPRTVAASVEWATTIDKNQYALDDGPCLQAARTREVVRVSGADAFEKWPAFAADSSLYGVKAYLAAPLVLSEKVVGAMNVYGFDPNAFGRLDGSMLQLITTAASAVIGNARRYTRMREIADTLKTAMASRAEIEQAKGVLMAVHGVTADEAFARLVTQSQHSNTKLATVARDLLASLRR